MIPVLNGSASSHRKNKAQRPRRNSRALFTHHGGRAASAIAYDARKCRRFSQSLLWSGTHLLFSYFADYQLLKLTRKLHFPSEVFCKYLRVGEIFLPWE